MCSLPNIWQKYIQKIKKKGTKTLSIYGYSILAIWFMTKSTHLKLKEKEFLGYFVSGCSNEVICNVLVDDDE